MSGHPAGYRSGELEETTGTMEDITVHEVSQWAVDHASCITFAQVRALAMKQGLTIRDLVQQFQEEVEHPREVFTRVWDRRLGAVVMPYGAVIAWYEQVTAPTPAQEAEPTCACGCGVRVWGRRKWASPGCRQRAYRQARTVGKPGAAA